MLNAIKLWWKNLLSTKQEAVEKKVVVEQVIEQVVEEKIEVIKLALKKRKKHNKRSKHATFHAKERFEERHGIVLNEHMVASFIHDIENEQAQFVEDTYDATQSWITKYDGKKYKIIYNPVGKKIITVYSNIKRKRKNNAGRNRREMNAVNQLLTMLLGRIRNILLMIEINRNPIWRIMYENTRWNKTIRL